MEKIIKELGNIEGDLLVFGGPYSNIHALKALQNEAKNYGINPDNIICTGDIVAYGAFPDECIQLIREWGIHCIVGNVELSLRDDTDDCGCNFNEGGRCDTFSKQWFPFAKNNLSPSSLDYLFTLPDMIKLKNSGKPIAIVHGASKVVSQYIFASTDWGEKQKEFERLGVDVILAGHCGIPFIEENTGKTWINAGVIGMPANDGTTDTWYVIIKDGQVNFYRLQYDHDSAHDAMIEANLPTTYAQTLINGIWDNCEILPEEETRKQGIRLDLEKIR